jgi:hypothetical protein
VRNEPKTTIIPLMVGIIQPASLFHTSTLVHFEFRQSLPQLNSYSQDQVKPSLVG